MSKSFKIRLQRGTTDKITKLVDVVADGNFPNQARPHEDLDKDSQENHIDQNGGKIPFKTKRTEVRKAEPRMTKIWEFVCLFRFAQ